MPVQKRSRVASFALSTLTSAVIGAVILPPAHAAGLGKLTVLSALGQPLRAEIELTAVAPEEASGLAVKLAPAEAFRAANIEFNPALLNLRFEIEQRGGRQFIRVSSAQPVNEPFVDLLLELSWANGRLVREYTFLLDPAELRGTQAPQVAAPVDVNRGAAQPAAAAPARPAAAPAAAPSKAETAAADEAREVRVKRGDTLSGIASGLRPADVSLDMMLVALYRANPEAFRGNNMNRLKSGRILAVPDAQAVRGTGRAEARGVVVAHAADFNAYRAKLAGQVEAATPAPATDAQQSAGGKITAKVEERPNAVNEARDQLKLSKAGEASGKAGAPVGGSEDKIAKEQQTAEAAARVKELEKNVSDLENLMAVKNGAAADAQNRVPELSSNGAPVPAAPQPVTTKPATPVKAHAAPVVVPPKQMEPGIVDVLKDNIQAIGIALAALLAGAALLLARRRKATGTVVPKAAVALPVEPASPHSLFAEAGGQSVDTSNSVFNSNFAPSASQLDTNEVDPVAEADVYIAYGRDAQAEEILKEALRTHPERHPVRLKLLEIYANRKDTRAFETQAGELLAQTRGQGDEWAQAAALGRSIDPANALYAQAGGAGNLAAGAAVAGATAFAATEAAQADDFASALDDAIRAEEPAAPAPEAAVNALDFDFGDSTALPASEPAPAATTAAPSDNAFADRLADFDFADHAAQPADEGLARPAVPAQPQAPTVAETDADHMLDFDLGGLNFDAPAPAPTPAPAANDVPDLAFDLPDDVPPAARVDAASVPVDDEFDFALPGDAETAATPAAAPAAADPLAELDLMDFDVPGAVPPQAASVEPPVAPAAAEPTLALDEQDFGLDLPEDDNAATPPPPAFDLSGIDLDLDTATPEVRAPAVALTPQQMEMDTKLDLAIAYQEIGDKEGARELLDEVLRGGSDDQVTRANQMLAQLG
jgi:pilus assembly protein FimV